MDSKIDDLGTMQGRITSLTRGRPFKDNVYVDQKKLVSLIIESDGSEHIVDLPIKTNSDFEVIPYQLALVGFNVRYSKKGERWEEGYTTEWELEVLSGALKGNTYKSSHCV